MLSLADLPEALLLETLKYLQPVDVIRCSKVSPQLHQTLTTSDVCRHLLDYYFPRSREGRLLHTLFTAEEDLENANLLLDTKDWTKVFSTVSRRYYHLTTATHHELHKIISLKDPQCLQLRGVTPWNRYLRANRTTLPFQCGDPMWAYGRDEGLLVYPDTQFRYEALDVATGQAYTVPFETQDKIVRRVRLNAGVLVFEWADRIAHHQINERTAAHRHYATAFDFKYTGTSYDILPDLKSISDDSVDGKSPSWDITFRTEWRIHYLGLPITDNDRFFSAHNSTHYAVYIYQPNRSPYGENDPLERLIVWEIGSPPPYPLPSDFDSRPLREPQAIHRLVNAGLEPWGVRQSDTPRLRSLALDDITVDPHTGAPTGHVFFIEEDHQWSDGPHSSPEPPLHHVVRSTGIPLSGDSYGPHWMEECGKDDLPSVESCRRSGMAGRRWPGGAPCWRHQKWPWIADADIVDAAAGVRISAYTIYKGSMGVDTIDHDVFVALRNTLLKDDGDHPNDMAAKWMRHNEPSSVWDKFSHNFWTQLMGKGFISGDERWVIGQDSEGHIAIMTF